MDFPQTRSLEAVKVQFKLNFLDSLRFLISGREKLSFGGNTKKNMWTCIAIFKLSNCFTDHCLHVLCYVFFFVWPFSKFAKNNLSSYMSR